MSPGLFRVHCRLLCLITIAFQSIRQCPGFGEHLNFTGFLRGCVAMLSIAALVKRRVLLRMMGERLPTHAMAQSARGKIRMDDQAIISPSSSPVSAHKAGRSGISISRRFTSRIKPSRLSCDNWRLTVSIVKPR